MHIHPLSQSILVTGGAGYIGSHTCLELLLSGYEVVVVDNLVNSSEETLKRVQKLAGKELKFYKVDLLDKDALHTVFENSSVDAVIHFAGLKAAGESVSMPLQYYHNNVTGTLILCEVMDKYNVKNLVFSSTASVYGSPHKFPITEDFPTVPENPYGASKLMIEEILCDLFQADNAWNITVLRYFNAVGAHSSGLLGEDPAGIPNNLTPYITQVAIGRLPELFVYGNDYSTSDGTGVRDYIHVMDLADGHIKALEKIISNSGLNIYNLGTGRGYSVLEMIAAFEKAAGRKIPYKFARRRPGDIATCYADSSKAKRELGWSAKRNIDEICIDLWRWQSQNPSGYNCI
ncbi:MAG: UDP-glucose 4-epimerase GalE [Spirochaetales bacterium]|jgi:UDP-glucose 4-epimerase|nr:UDP-glucose 4-epimerase GalE [Spirochaetales bacterium]